MQVSGRGFHVKAAAAVVYERAVAEGGGLALTLGA